MREELKVKVGDKVLYRYWTFGGTIERINTVTRVTPTGRIRVEGSDSQFDKYGRQMGGDSWRGGANLSIPTDDDYKLLYKKTGYTCLLMAMTNIKKWVRDGFFLPEKKPKPH